MRTTFVRTKHEDGLGLLSDDFFVRSDGAPRCELWNSKSTLRALEQPSLMKKSERKMMKRANWKNI